MVRAGQAQTIGDPVSDLLPVPDYVPAPYSNDITIDPTYRSHFLLAGTGLDTDNPPPLTGLLGYEVDMLVPGISLSGIVPLGKSPLPVFVSGRFDVYNPPGFACDSNTAPPCYSNLTWYSTGVYSVFATGSMVWSWGLDDYFSDSSQAVNPRPALSQSAAQQLTANVLAAITNNQ